MRALWLGIVMLLALAAPVRAQGEDAVALLPLDTEARLAIYGQPVASEIARSLVQGGVNVVVVGPRMAVPQHARLIVDGTISSNKNDTVVFVLRVRNPVDGTTLATTQAIAQGLPNIDKAAVELSATILPIVRTQLAALKEPPKTKQPDVRVAVVNPSVPRPLVLGLKALASAEPLRAALATEITPWAAKRNYEIKTDGTGLAISFDVKGYSVTKAKIPYAKARVRVVIADAGATVFDRVVITDSVLGDKDISPDALAARTAREVLDILRPHLRRTVGGWR